MNTVCRHFFVALLLLLPAKLLAQHGQPMRYGLEDGLPAEITKAIVRDSAGFIWVGSDEGLVRYDGYRAQNMGHLLPSSYVKELHAHGSRIFVVTDLGLAVLESAVDTVRLAWVLPGKGEESDSTLRWPKAFYRDARGRFWVGEANVVRVEEGGRMKRYPFEAPYNMGSFTRGFDFLDDGLGTLWATSHAGYLFWRDEARDTFLLAKHEPVFGSINASLSVDKGLFLVGGEQGLFEVAVDSAHQITGIRRLSDLPGISSIAISGNQLYFGSFNHGCHAGTYTRGRLLSHRVAGLPSEIQQLYADAHRNIWASTMSGAYLLPRTFFGTIDHARGYINALAVSPYGHVFLTNGIFLAEAAPSMTGGFQAEREWRDEIIRGYPDSDRHEVMSMAVGMHHLWAGVSYGYLYRYGLEDHQLQRLPGIKPSQSVFFLHADERGNAWACQDQHHGVVRIAPDLTVHDYESILQARMLVVREDDEGRVLLGGLSPDRYLFRYDADADAFENLSIPHPDGAPIVVNDLAMGAGDTIWLADGQRNQLLYRTAQGLGTAGWLNGFDVGIVKAVAVGADGSLWVACKQGLLHYRHGEVTLLTEKSGLASNSINYRGLLPDRNGGVLVATSKGVSYVANPEMLLQRTPPPTLLSVSANGEPYPLRQAGRAVFPSGTYLRLAISAMMYPSNGVEYQMRLQGEGDWEPVEGATPVLYRIPPGRHLLQLRARQTGGLQWSRPTQFEFEIALPWFRRWWAFLLFAVLAVGGVWGIVRLNTQRLKREKARLEKVIRDRTQEIWDKKQELEQQKDEIEFQNAELQHQKEEIQAQNEELFQLAEEIAAQRDKIERQHQDLGKAYRNVQVVSEIGKELAGHITLEALLQSAAAHLGSQLDAEVLAIGVHDAYRQELLFSWVERGKEDAVRQSADRLDDEGKLSVWVFLNQEQVLIGDFQQEASRYVPPLKAAPSIHRSHLYVPLVCKGAKLGVLTVQSRQPQAYDEQDAALLEALATYIATALDNAQAYEIIRSKNELITDSIRYAHQIQQAILPSAAALSAAFREHFVLYRPKDIVSGDFYWMAAKQLAGQAGVSHFVAVADCTGHGVPGAFMSLIGNRILNEVVFEKGLSEPAEVLELVDRSLREALGQRQGQLEAVLDGMEVALCRIDPPGPDGRPVHFAGAGSSLLHGRPGQPVARFRGNRRAIGGTWAWQEAFRQETFLVPRGGAIYLGSDGIGDQGDAARKKFGTPRLLALLSDIAALPMAEQGQRVAEALDAFRGEAEQRDDITLLGIRL